MPFTLAHPAIVLPLKFMKEGWLSLTGLVIGSITPDFGYFVQLKALRGYGHSLHGIFWFDLPIAILLSFLFHEIIRNPLIQNSPSFLQKKLSRYLGFQWKNFFKQNIFSVIVSIIIGAFSHILWDSFTHVDGYFTQSIPALSEYISLGYTPITVHNLISVICSFLGLMVVLYSILQLPSEKNVSVNRRFTGYWFFAVRFWPRCRFLAH